jgi:murein DD-endopeptidase MepM/ murein hydrolase activator NlpD
MVFAGLGGLLDPTAAQAPHPAVPRKAGGVAVTQCGKGVSLRLSSSRASQGSVVVIDVRSREGLEGVKGNWEGRELGFWEEIAAGGKGTTDHWRGLLGVDLEKAAGTYELTVFVTKKGSDAAGCGAKVTVVAGRFPTERLQVEGQFVEPNPEQAERAKAEQVRLRAIYDTVTPERLWKGKFRLPLDGARTGGNFGRRRVLNGQPGSPHSGVDFPAPTGAPVHATQAGRVVLAEGLFFPGNTVIVDHGLGVYTLYGHLSKISVGPGDEVEAGTVLGEVGATGRVTGPHLHWGLTVNRQRVNAMNLVRVLGAN